MHMHKRPFFLENKRGAPSVKTDVTQFFCPSLIRIGNTPKSRSFSFFSQPPPSHFHVVRMITHRKFGQLTAIEL